MTGCGGSATRMTTVAIPYLKNRPVFTSGDYSGRDLLQLKDEEIVVSFPYRLVSGPVSNLDKTACARAK